jgi:hypothetical protein
MPKLVLAFPSGERMASFVLECKITRVKTDSRYFTLTGEFSEECVKMALKDYSASIAKSTDVIFD